MALYKNITTSTQVKVGISKLKSLFVSAASATPTIAIYNEAQGGTTNVVISTFTPVAGTPYSFTGGDELGVSMDKGIYVVISGTVDLTIFYE